MSGAKGSTIGTVAGAVVGAIVGTFIFPGIGTFAGASYGAFIGGTIGGIVDYTTAGDQVNRQESIAGLQVQTSAYGQPIPQIFGTYRLAGNIIFVSPKKVHEHRTTEGGKGGPKRVSITKTYSVDLAIGLCETQVTGPMTAIQRCWADGTLIYDVNQRATLPTGWQFYPGTDSQPVDPTIQYWWHFFTPRFIYVCYVSMADYDMGPYPRVPNFTFEVTQDVRTLPGVVQALTQAAGVAPEDLLVDLPESDVQYLIGAVQPVKAILEQLMVAFRFYLRESSLRLEAMRLGSGTFVGEIPETDLDASERAEQTAGLRIQRERGRLLPTQVHLTYTSPGRSYQSSTQLATIGTLETVESPRAVATSVGLSDGDAKALAQENMDRIWIERTQYAFDVSRRWSWLEPGDRVMVTCRGQHHTLQLTEAHYGRPGLMQLKGKGDNAPVLFVPGAPPSVGEFPDVILVFLEPTTAYFLELPAMDSNDQSPRLFVIYTYPVSEEWPGAALYRSTDGGATYESPVHVGTLEAITGTASTVLPDAPGYLTDTTNTVRVVLTHGQIHSVTPEAFQGGGNLAFLGNELIQFREAELVAPGTYDLRHFWRGKRGTAWATGTHAVGERFTWIDQSVYRVEQVLEDRRIARQWKAVTTGLDIADTDAQAYAPECENLRPWPAATLRLDRVDTDWLISWRGVARFTGIWMDGTEASPDPDFLSYRVVIYGTGGVIVRQEDVAHTGGFQPRQVYTYTELQQLADFGGLVITGLDAQVFQVGRTDVSRPAAA